MKTNAMTHRKIMVEMMIKVMEKSELLGEVTATTYSLDADHS